VEDDVLSGELRLVAERIRTAADALVTRLDERELSPAQVVALLESIGQLDRERAALLERYRTDVAARVRRDEERSIRQYVLEALERIGTPQTPSFLEDYLAATALVQLNSSGVGALRRDERRAWQRDLEKHRFRKAYIVPCLQPDGRRAARWMARSDWPLAERIQVAGAEKLWVHVRVSTLVAAYREEEKEVDALYRERIVRYAREALGEDFVRGIPTSDQLFEEVEREAKWRIASLQAQVSSAQQKAAKRLGSLEASAQLWGVKGSSIA
jgi:hypothetical protein